MLNCNAFAVTSQCVPGPGWLGATVTTSYAFIHLHVHETLVDATEKLGGWGNRGLIYLY